MIKPKTILQAQVLKYYKVQQEFEDFAPKVKAVLAGAMGGTTFTDKDRAILEEFSEICNRRTKLSKWKPKTNI